MGIISLKVLQKAVDKKDHTFLVKNVMEKLMEYGWTHRDIAEFARKLEASCNTESF